VICNPKFNDDVNVTLPLGYLLTGADGSVSGNAYYGLNVYPDPVVQRSSVLKVI
jgi:hypothetical protein